jgi:hypothetical protein
VNKTQIIDVTRSAVITDPEAFYENLMSTGQEDSPERTIPIVAYEGYNFLPTLYGYRSYFDTTATLGIVALGSRCDSVVLYQFANYSNVLVALCEDGIWTNSGGSASEAWAHKVTLSTPSSGSYLAWTYCVIENVLYMYRQGNASVYKLTPTAFGPVTIASFVPNFLNMTGQMGIFRANGRLGFWDSANSISWSSLFDFIDFTPAIITLAANAIFNDVLGRIVHVQAFGSGFIIYSTKNIVGAQFNTTGSILFSAKSIAEQAGIWTSKQVCQGATDMEHFAYTNTGIKRVKSDYTVEDIFVGIYDFLRESRDPVYLSFLQGRYLFLSLIDPAYISGRVSFEVVTLAELTVRLLYNGGELTDPEDIPDAIDGIPLEQDISNKFLEGATEGLYAQWRASGSKMVPSIISSMSPYQLDDPFTPDDDFPYEGNATPYYTQEQLDAARDTGSFTDVTSINDSTPPLLDLGWTNAPLGTGVADTSLTRFFDRQEVEWAEYAGKIAQARTMINDTPDKVSHYSDPTVYESTPPSFPTTDTGYVEFATMLDPSFNTTTTKVFSGVGSYSASVTYKTIYNQEFPIKRRVLEEDGSNGTYTGAYIRVWFTDGGDQPSLSYVTTPTGGVAWYLGTILSTAGYQTDGGFTGRLQNYAEDADNTAIYNTWRAFLETVFDSSDYTVGGTTISLTQVVILQDYFVEASQSFATRVNYEFTGNWGFGTETRIRSYSLGVVIGTQRYRKDTTYIQVGASRTTPPVESTMYATQKVVDWGQWLEDNPNPDFPYDTNELMIGAPAYSLTEGTTLPEHLDVTFPGATFLLQDATTAPIFPNYTGALVFDTGLQKWGKCKADYRTLVDYSPINSNHDQIISYTNFGLDSGILKSDGSIRLFSSKCTDSFIRYGKLAFSRQGYTYPEEIQIHFRRPFTGIIGVDASLDGRSIHSELHQEETFAGVGLARIYPTHAGKWYTMSIGGEFDLRSIEFTGRVSGIR